MNLPEHLSPETAMALFDFLIDLERAFWEKYEHLLIPLYREQLYIDEHAQYEDEDLSPEEDFNEQLPLF